jgi:putative transposase
MGFDVKLIDELLAGRSTVAEIAGENGLVKQLTKAILERTLAAELTTHLGYEKHDVVGHHSGNSRNGASQKRLKGDFGTLEIEVPRDRAGSFEPQLVAKGQTRWHGFDDKILSLYARGMTCREIQGHLEEMYQVEVSPRLISTVTDAVLDEVKAWQSMPLDVVYAIVYLDALVVKMRSEGRVENRAVYVAIGIDMEGRKDVLGLWTSANEGAKFWLQVLTELKNRGVQDIFIACVDGLKGFPQAIETAYPKTTVQLCIVHMVRGSLSYVGWKERKAVAADLKNIYRAATVEEAERQLEEFARKWDRRMFCGATASARHPNESQRRPLRRLPCLPNCRRSSSADSRGNASAALFQIAGATSCPIRRTAVPESAFPNLAIYLTPPVPTGCGFTSFANGTGSI